MTAVAEKNKVVADARAEASSDNAAPGERKAGSLRRHVPIYLLGRAVPAALSFVMLAVFTRQLSPNDFGIYSLVIASSGLLHAVLYSWLSASVLRFLPTAADRSAILALTAALLTRTVAITLILSVIAILILPAEQYLVVALTASLSIAQSWLGLHLSIFRAEMRPLLYSAIEVARAAGALCLGLMFLRVGWGPFGVLLAVLLAYLVPSLFTIRHAWGTAWRSGVEKAQWRPFLAYGLPTIATFAFSYVIRSSDRLMLGWLATPAEAGLYAAGYDLAFQSIDALLLVANLAAFPLLIAAAESGDQRKLAEQARKNVVLLTAIGLPAAVGLSLLAHDVSRIVLGSAFARSAASILPLVCAAALISGYKGYYFDHAFHLGRRTLQLATVGATAAVLNVASNLVLIPRYGGLGAAWSTLFCFGISLLLSYAIGRRLVRLPLPFRELLPLLLATAAMGVVMLAFPSVLSASGLAVKVVTGALVYGSVLFALDVAEIRSTMVARWRQA